MIENPHPILHWVSIVSSFIIFGCGSGGPAKEGQADLTFKIIEEGQGRQVKAGDFLKLHLVYNGPDGTTMFDSDRVGGGDFILESTAPLFRGAMEEYFLELHEGDSAHFSVSADSMYKYTLEGPIPSVLKKGDQLKIGLRLIKVYTAEELMAERERLRLQRIDSESRAIEIYLLENSLPVQAVKPGVYFFELKKGSGIQPSPSDSVFIRYTGRFLNGEVFDSSHQSATELLSYRLGNGERLMEWERAVSTMRVGSVARLILCSPFAYGSAGAGIVPPDTPLVFDLELVACIPASAI